MSEIGAGKGAKGRLGQSNAFHAPKSGRGACRQRRRTEALVSPSWSGISILERFGPTWAFIASDDIFLWPEGKVPGT